MSSASLETDSSRDTDTRQPAPSPKPTAPQEPNISQNILLFLIAFRILNTLAVRTFFQPDEFFQSLEPAWEIAFGKESGAWITWEWKHQLRSSIHPYIFAAVYWVSDRIATILRLSPLLRADLLIAAPKATQAVFAGLGDYFTWRLAERVYGYGTGNAWAVLALTVLSPWQWFCSTRTFSNSLETTLTVVALYLWPWRLSTAPQPLKAGDRIKVDDLLSLRGSLLLAAFACVLRPTNLMIWATLAFGVVANNSPVNRQGQRKRGSNVDLYVFIREGILCGSAVLLASLLADRAYFGSWTLPPLKFLYFNLAQSLAVFYGRNDWHYYLSQGYPLLLTTALPFALVGLFQSLDPRTLPSAVYPLSISRQLALVSVVVPLVLSFISHKEVRFIYPLLPSLHVLAGSPLNRFFGPSFLSPSSRYIPHRLTLIFLTVINVVVAYYVSLSHASGPLAVFQYLREQHILLPEKAAASEIGANLASPSTISLKSYPKMTVGFLMPCHSTPWRSHLVFPNIDAWALTCEPPVNLNVTQKATYLDEADQFYNDPTFFLRENMIGGTRHIPGRPSYQTSRVATNPLHTPTTHHPIHEKAYYPDQTSTKHNWPDYLIFFAQLEPLLQTELRSSSYAECYRTFNTAWHDDWRRKGDIVVWCLDAPSQRDWKRKQYQASHNSRSGSPINPPLQRQELFDIVIDRVRREAGLNGHEASTKWSWPKWPWGQHPEPARPAPRSWPFWKQTKPAHISWLEENIYSRSPQGSAWSWPWERKKQSWWADWMTSLTNYWQAKQPAPEGPEERLRELWS